MRTVEFVKLKTDTNYIPIKYAILEVNIGSTLATSNAWIKAISHGCDTEANLTAFKLTSDGYEPVPDEKGNPIKSSEYISVDKSGIVGTIGEYQVVTLDTIEPYNRPSIGFTPNIELG